MEKVFTNHRFDEIIAATPPRPISRWLRADLPHRAKRGFGLPVTTIITKRWPLAEAARTRTSTGMRSDPSTLSRSVTSRMGG
jgi:hypothetical protein